MKKILFLIIALHLFLLSRMNFTAWPEMLSYPYLFFQGFTLYKDFIVPYPPLLIWFLAGIFNLFGFNPIVLKLTTWFLISLTDLLLFIILQKIIKKKHWIVGLMLIYVILQSLLDGNMLWFDFTTVAPILAAFYFLLKWINNRNNLSLFLTTLFLWIAVMVKQISLIYFAAFFLIYLSQVKKKIFLGLFFILFGIIVAVTPLLIYLVWNKAFVEFWQWTIIYPLLEWPKFPGYVNYRATLRELFMITFLALPLFGIIFKIKEVFKDKILGLSLLFLSAAVIATYPRLSFFHLQPVLAFWIIVVGQLLTKFNGILMKAYLLLILVAVIAGFLITFPKDFGNNIRFYEASQRKTAALISQINTSDDRILLLGLNSSLYAYANIVPPIFWGDNFGWYLEIPGVQEWVISGMEKTPPEYIFWKKPGIGNWFDLGVYQPRKITDYIQTNYYEIGKAEPEVGIWQRK